MIRSKAFIGALVLSTALAASACATETSYTAAANNYAYNTYIGYPSECSYGLGYECPPNVYSPPVVYDYDHLDRFDHFHYHPTHVGHGLGAFGGHGFAGHGGFGFGGHGAGGHR